MSKTASIYRFNVHLDGSDKRLLDKLVKKKKLKKTDVVRQLIRQAASEEEVLKRAANG